MIYGFWFLLMKKRFNHSSSLTSNGEKEKGFLVEMEQEIQRDTERNKTEKSLIHSMHKMTAEKVVNSQRRK